MESNNIIPLNELHVTKDHIFLKVRISRLWRQAFFKDPTQTFFVEMILMDEQGNKMQGSVLNRYLIKFERFLQEGTCLFIDKPTLGDNSSKYRIIDNPSKVCLAFSTVVRRCNDFSGSLHGFDFVSFQPLLENAIAENQIVDVMGYVYTFYPIENVTLKNGKVTPRMNVHLQDLEGRNLYVTLWNGHAEQMNNFISNNTNEANVVIILQFGRFKFYNGKAYVSTAFNVSKLFINDDIDEIKSFKNILAEKTNEATSSSQRVIGSSMLVTMRDDFLEKTVFNSIAQVIDIKEPQSVIVLGTIKCVHSEINWYYLACTECNRKVISKYIVKQKTDGSDNYEEHQVLTCTNLDCKKEVVSAVPRFKIPLRVQDSTGAVSLTLFDRDAKKLLNTSTSELIEKQKGDINTYPDEFKSFLDKRFAFKIDIIKYNVEKNSQFFAISKLTDDFEIISALENKYNADQGADFASPNAPSTDFPSQETIDLKVDRSIIEDNVTPLLNEKACNLKSAPCELKRNLVELYDDDTPTSSSTKTRTKLTKGDKDGKNILLTPKLEK